MAYLGNTPQTQSFTPAIDYFNGTGATTAFTLSRPVASVAQVQVVIENVPQNPSSAYTVSGQTITFTSAPPSGTNNIYVEYTSPITQYNALSQSPVVYGNLNFGSTGARIQGDFSNATVANRVAFQNSTANTGTSVNVIPNGTGPNSGFVAYDNSSMTNASRMRIVADSATSLNSVISDISGTGTYYPMALWTGGSERMRIDTSGNVGIGTSTANFRLTTSYTAPASFTNASGDFIQMWQATNTNAIGVAMETTNKVARFVTNNGYVTAFNNASTEAMRIDSSGNVGIGTSSPSTKLTVAGTFRVDGARSSFYANSEPYAIQLNYSTASSNGPYIGSPSADTFVVSNSGGTERMRIDSSGNLRFNSGYGSVATAYGCRAWVNFNGTGTVAIRGSGNVTSITDNGTGNYTVNLTSAMPDANYSVVGSANSTTYLRAVQTPTLATTSFRVSVVAENATLQDIDTISAALFR